MTEEQMLSMITRVSNKYSVKLSAQQIQSLIEGIKVKAAQQGTLQFSFHIGKTFSAQHFSSSNIAQFGCKS